MFCFGVLSFFTTIANCIIIIIILFAWKEKKNTHDRTRMLPFIQHQQVLLKALCLILSSARIQERCHTCDVIARVHDFIARQSRRVRATACNTLRLCHRHHHHHHLPMNNSMHIYISTVEKSRTARFDKNANSWSRATKSPV